MYKAYPLTFSIRIFLLWNGKKFFVWMSNTDPYTATNNKDKSALQKYRHLSWERGKGCCKYLCEQTLILYVQRKGQKLCYVNEKLLLSYTRKRNQDHVFIRIFFFGVFTRFVCALKLTYEYDLWDVSSLVIAISNVNNSFFPSQFVCVCYLFLYILHFYTSKF